MPNVIPGKDNECNVSMSGHMLKNIGMASKGQIEGFPGNSFWGS